MNARSRFSVDADWWYACTSRSGSGIRADASNGEPLTMCPRNDGRSTSPWRSVGFVRGLANWPAMRPTFTTGTPIEYVSTTAICRMTRSFSRMLSAEKSSNDSAQSPAWRRNALPAATSASDACNDRDSPANTSGG